MIAIGLCCGEQLPCLAPDALGFLEEIKAAALLLLIRSPICHSFQFFRVPCAVHRDLCSGGFELPEIIRGEFDANRSDVFFKALQFGGAGNGNDKHRVPKTKKPCGRRINLSFRWMNSPTE